MGKSRVIILTRKFNPRKGGFAASNLYMAIRKAVKTRKFRARRQFNGLFTIGHKARHHIPKRHKSMTDNFFQMEHATVVDTGMTHQLAQKFIAANPELDVYSDSLKFVVRKNTSFLGVISKIKASITGGRVIMPETHLAIFYRDDEYPTLAVLTQNNQHNEDTEDVHSLSVVIYGRRDDVETIKALIEKDFHKEKMAKVKWWYEGRHGAETRDIHLPDEPTFLAPEFYPDIANGPNEFLDGYFASKASVLLLAGPPGTGKTTLLRRAILDRKMVAHVIYDEKLMQTDSVFQSFLFDDNSEVMIIEDADTILSDRERDGNKMMSRFLSISDGLIKLPNKKLIFTTNLGAADFGKVDDALLRPGRCYGVVRTRELDLSEAQAAAKVASLPVPIEKKTYTIAELFNQDQTHRVRVRRIGF